MSLTGFIKNNFLLPDSRKYIGLDFCGSAMRMVQIEKHHNVLKLCGWTEKKIPKGIIEGYEIIDRQKFKEIFNDALVSSHGKIKKSEPFVVSIPENKVFSRLINIPSMDENEADEAIKWETEANIPISIEDVYFDWQIIEHGPKTMEVLVAATPKKIIDNYLGIFDELGVMAAAFETESTAIGRAICKSDKENILAANIGYNGTTLAIYRGCLPVFTSSSSVSGGIFTDAIAKSFNISAEKAESKKIKSGLETEGEDKEKLIEAIKPALKNLIQEIDRTINFFDANLSKEIDKRSRQIVLCGEGSNLKGLENFLTLNFKMPVKEAEIGTNLEMDKKAEMRSEEAKRFAIAIGLSLREK